MAVWAHLQRVLPHHFISRLAGRLATTTTATIKNPLNRWFVRTFDVDLSDALVDQPESYNSFNALFTRALRPNARPLAGDELTLISPVDGTVSESGPITGDKLIQAKGRDYRLTELLGDPHDAQMFEDGYFATIYLAPYNYHRIHMPSTGVLTRMRLIPGRLFSVNRATAASIDRLFARNERVASFFDSEHGPFCVVAVGALNVGSIDTVWHGTVTPPSARTPRTWDYPDTSTLARGAQLGHFNFGSTVILVWPRGSVELRENLAPGTVLRMGESIGRWRARRT